MARNDRTVSKRPDGSWANKKDGTSRAGSLHDTQREAIDAARRGHSWVTHGERHS